MSFYCWLIACSLLNATVMFLAGVLPTAWLRHRYPIPSCLLASIHMAALGLIAWLLFWVFWLAPTVGQILVLALLGTALVGSLWAWKNSLLSLRDLIRTQDYWAPMLLMLSATLIYETMIAAKSTAANDFPVSMQFAFLKNSLPIDNILPEMLLHRIFYGRPLEPFIDGWLASDRPPLQSAICLLQHAITVALGQGGSGYGTIATLCQTSLFCGIWSLMVALQLPRSSRRMTLLLMPATGFIFLNSMFTWPKLLAAGFILGAISLWLLRSKSPALSLLSGLSLGLGMLGHGGVIFTAIPIVVWVTWSGRRLRDWSAVLRFATAAAVVYFPWLFFQRFIDPPGDRLIKMHLAGIEGMTGESALQAIAGAYRTLTPAALWNVKLQNLKFLFGPWGYGESFFHSIGHPDAIQRYEFLHPMLSLSWASIGFLIFWPRRDVIPSLRICWLLIGSSLMLWWLLMFSGNSTCTHQGSYATMLLLFVALGHNLGTLPRVARNGLLAINVCWFLWYWWRYLPGDLSRLAPLLIPLALLGFLAWNRLVLRITTDPSSRA